MIVTKIFSDAQLHFQNMQILTMLIAQNQSPKKPLRFPNFSVMVNTPWNNG